MNESPIPDNIASGKAASGLVKFCFVVWIAVILVVYFLAFGARYVVSLLGRLGLDSLGERLGCLSDGLMTWFSARGG